MFLFKCFCIICSLSALECVVFLFFNLQMVLLLLAVDDKTTLLYLALMCVILTFDDAKVVNVFRNT